MKLVYDKTKLEFDVEKLLENKSDLFDYSEIYIHTQGPVTFLDFYHCAGKELIKYLNIDNYNLIYPLYNQKIN